QYRECGRPKAGPGRDHVRVLRRVRASGTARARGDREPEDRRRRPGRNQSVPPAIRQHPGKLEPDDAATGDHADRLRAMTGCQDKKHKTVICSTQSILDFGLGSRPLSWVSWLICPAPVRIRAIGEEGYC